MLGVDLLRFFVLWPIIQAVLFALFLGAPWVISETGRFDLLVFYFWLPATLFPDERLFSHGIPVSSQATGLALGFYAVVGAALSVAIALAFSSRTPRGNVAP